VSYENFRLPAHSNELYNRSLNRCNRLIESRIWDIPKHRLKAWCNKFVTQEEQYLCALLLDAFIYRSAGMVGSLCHHAIRSVLPNNLISYPTSFIKWTELLQSGVSGGCVFVAVEGVSKQGSREPAKSGQVVLREFHRSGAVNKRLFIDAGELLKALGKSKAINTVVYIDDFCGTGAQFEAFYNKFTLSNIPDGVAQIYLPLACHAKAFERFNLPELSQVKLCPVELLDEGQNFFREINGTFRGDSLNSVATAKAFYLELLNKNRIKTQYPLGWGSLATTYAFSFSTPNNTLPIFWSSMNGWPSLLDR